MGTIFISARWLLRREMPPGSATLRFGRRWSERASFGRHRPTAVVTALGLDYDTGLRETILHRRITADLRAEPTTVRASSTS